MRLVLQRVSWARLSVDNQPYSAISKGLLVLFGIETEDTEQDSLYLAEKVCNLRIFSDEHGKMNLDLKQTQAELMIVSQFTLHASTKKGNRPSFLRSATPETAIPLYEHFIGCCNNMLGRASKTGVFGAYMHIELANDGPVTLVLDSKNRE